MGGLVLELALTWGDEGALRPDPMRVAGHAFPAKSGSWGSRYSCREIPATPRCKTRRRTDPLPISSPTQALRDFANAHLTRVYRGGARRYRLERRARDRGPHGTKTKSPIETVEHGLIERGIRICRGGFFFASKRDMLGTRRRASGSLLPARGYCCTRRPPRSSSSGRRAASIRSACASSPGGFSGILKKALDEWKDRIRAVIMVAIKKLE